MHFKRKMLTKNSVKKASRKSVVKVPDVKGALRAPTAESIARKAKKKASAKRPKKFDETKDCSNNGQLEWRTYENMTPEMRLKREMFVHALTIDWNMRNAAIRVGVPPTSASTQANRFMKEPYVLELLAATREDFAERAKNVKSHILFSMYQEMGSIDGNRVAAARLIAEIEGLIGQGKTEINFNQNNNVMVVPMSADPSEWEVKALQEQQTLKDAVRT